MSVSTRSYRALRATTFGLVLLVLIAFMLRWLANPLAQYYRVAIQAELEQQLHHPVQLDTLAVYWRGWQPEIQINHLQATANLGPLITIQTNQLSFRVRPLASLLSLSLQLDQLEADQVDIDVRLQPPNRDPRAVINDLLKQLPRLGAGRVQQARLRIRDQDKPPFLVLKGLSAQIWTGLAEGTRLDLWQHQAAGQLQLSWRWKTAEQAQIYLNAQAIALPHINSDEQTHSVNAQFTGELWGQWQQQDVATVQGHVQLAIAQLAKLPFISETGNLHYWRSDQGYKAHIRFPDTQIQLASDGEKWQIVADRLSLKAFTGLLPVSVHSGWLLNAQLIGDGLQWRYLSGDIEQLAIAPTPTRSGVEGVYAQLAVYHAQDQRIHGTLISRNQPMTLTGNFWSQPIDNVYVGGRIAWQQDQTGWRISPTLQVSHQQAGVHVQGTLCYQCTATHKDPKQPNTDRLLVNTNAISIAAIKRYLPLGIMPDGLKTWLQNALVGGEAGAAQLVLTGDVAQFPFDKGGGEFMVSVPIHHGVLRYQPQFPDITQLHGNLIFYNQGMRAAATGYTQAVKLDYAEIMLADLRHADIVVSGKSTADLKHMQTFIESSLLKKPLAALNNLFVLDGVASLDLTLQIPIHSKRKLAVLGDLQVKRAQVQFKQTPAKVDQVQGHIVFDEQGPLFGGQLSGLIEKQAIKIKIGHQKESKTRIIIIDAESQLTPNELARLFELQQGQAYLAQWQVAGRDTWALQVVYSLASNALTLSLQSPLRALSLTSPFGGITKHQDEAYPLQIDAALSDKSSLVKVNLGDDLTAELTVAHKGSGLALQKITLLCRHPNMQGQINWSANQPVRIALQKLNWIINKPAPTDFAQPASSPSIAVARSWPAFDIKVDRLLINGGQIGALNAVAAPTKTGYALTRFVLLGEPLTINAQGNWVQDKTQSKVDVQLTITSPNPDYIADLMARDLGITGQTKLKADLSWQGGFNHIDFNTLMGTAHVRVDKGFLQEMETGPARLLGLFSFSSLPRRLALDFTDIYVKGLAFDRLEGNFMLNAGDVVTDNLILDAPSVAAEIKGRIGITTRDYDQNILVTPRVSMALPIAGAAAGGPVVGGVLFVAERLFQKQIDQIARISYRLQGKWGETNPEIKNINIDTDTVPITALPPTTASSSAAEQ